MEANKFELNRQIFHVVLGIATVVLLKLGLIGKETGWRNKIDSRQPAIPIAKRE